MKMDGNDFYKITDKNLHVVAQGRETPSSSTEPGGLSTEPGPLSTWPVDKGLTRVSGPCSPAAVMRPTAPRAYCPTCLLDGEGVIWRANGVIYADYICPAGHIWQTHWLEDPNGDAA